ncbi:MAG: MgtC/SapB family protein [Rhodospirillales bacterium]|nr:MgtC/SapB family protein [Rhodospirillales bacterium]
MDLENQSSRMALALGIGLLVGLERGWRTREAAPGSRTAGIRTFAISGLLGGVLGAMAGPPEIALSTAGAIILTVGFVTYTAVIASFSYAENRADETFSATTPIAAMLTFALGIYAVIGNMWVAAASGVAATAILAAREELHDWVGNLTWSELRSGLVLLAMTCIALPVMPTDPVGPYGGVNPREVWIIAIVLACVSFLAYVAVKYFGARGVLLAGALGGLVSSTAVTIDSARRAASREGPSEVLAASVSIASAIMFVRVMAIVTALKPTLLARIAPALVCATVVAVAFAVYFAYWRQPSGDNAQATKPVVFRNPFSLWSVVGFALFLAGVIVVTRAVGENLGTTAAVLGAVVAGLADVDAITVSLTRMTPTPLTAEHAAVAILAAVASDTVSKIGIGAVIGRGRFAAHIATVAAACLIAGALASLLMISRS